MGTLQGHFRECPRSQKLPGLFGGDGEFQWGYLMTLVLGVAVDAVGGGWAGLEVGGGVCGICCCGHQSAYEDGQGE